MNEVNNLKTDLNDTNLEVQNQIGTLTDNDRIIQEGISGLETQFSDLEELSKLSVTETCMELKNYGLTVSKEFDLDPDGLNKGQIPIKAWCEIPEGITIIGETKEIEITMSQSPDHFTHHIECPPFNGPNQSTY